MSVMQRLSDAPPTELVVAAVVRVEDGSNLAAVLEAIAGQGYGLAAVYAVGGPETVRETVEAGTAEWAPNLETVLARLDGQTSHVWFLHEDALPRPDALASLVTEIHRVEASVAGSKVLHPGPERRLESVGGATDVFGQPYWGLEPGEVDQGQHDVVRDVSFVAGISMVARKDLMLGLGGPDPAMAPEAAAIDLSWRARVAGGRVVVVPSSEVVHLGVCAASGRSWKEQAGRARVLLKNYSWMTWIWSVPASFLIGLVTSLIRTFLDRRTALWQFARAWLWNAAHFPSVVGARRRLKRARVAGDEELFRYQVRGSIEVQETASVIGERVRRRTEERAPEAPHDAVSVTLTSGQPYLGALVVGAVFVVAATWSLLIDGVPVVGFTLPVSDWASDTLRSVAGGWNPAGLGSAKPLHPSVAPTALASLLLLSNGSLTTTVLTVGAIAAALLGTTRLLSRLGASAFTRYVSGAAVAAGPATLGLTSPGYWPGLLAVAVMPWAAGSLFRSWPPRLRARIGWIATATILTGLGGMFTPVGIAVPLLTVTGWAAFGPGSWKSVARGVAPTLLGLVLLNPWLTGVSIGDVLAEGRLAFWEPSVVVVGLLVGAGVLALLLGDAWVAGLAATGGLLVAAGAILARASEVGVGREPAVAGLVAAALGSGLVVASAFELPRRMEVARLWRKLLGWVGAAVALLVVGSALLIVPEGRAGLPEDRFGESLAFTVNRADPHGPDRILLVGPDGTLPGEYRTSEGFTYRVVSAPVPPLEEAWLEAPAAGDVALEETLASLLSEDEVRPGEALAPFGIKWVVVTGPSAFDAALGSQLDLRPLSLLDYQVFENELPSPRAVASDQTAWSRDGTGYAGPAGGRVYVSENADSRWGDDWSPSSWANEVSGDSGSIRFGGVPLLRLISWLTAGFAVVLVGLVVWGGRRHS